MHAMRADLAEFDAVVMQLAKPDNVKVMFRRVTSVMVSLCRRARGTANDAWLASERARLQGSANGTTSRTFAGILGVTKIASALIVTGL